MLKNLNGELATSNQNQKADFNRRIRLSLFNHYLNHRYNADGRSKPSHKTVLENIIALYNRKYAPEKYEIKKDQNIDGKPNVIYSNDSLEDLRSFAHLVVWEATKLYIAFFSSSSLMRPS